MVLVKPIVAIVGRPNVGKSTLFNRLVGHRLAIIEDFPGVTRDRLYADADWNGREFTLVDTGGLQLEIDDQLAESVTRQAEVAIREADVIVFVTDVRDGVLPGDDEVAHLLRRVKKPVLLCVNKVDNLKREDAAHEFYRLGLREMFTVSAAHGLGTGDLLDRIVSLLPPMTEADVDPSLVKVAVVGRPNVGKSTLINALIGAERMIVSEIAGTTRDAIDVLMERDGDRYLLIDTAGMRRRSRVDAPVEYYSVLRALRAIDRADVVLIVLSASDGVTDQDQKIAKYVLDQGKGAILVANKWDIIEKDDKTMNRYIAHLRDRLKYMEWAETAFTSALTGSRLPKLLPIVKRVWLNHGRRIATAELNQVIREAQVLTPGPTDKGVRFKIYYAAQVQTRPPLCLLYTNDPELCHFSYRRYLENRLRETFDFRGTPLRLVLKRRVRADRLARPGRKRAAEPGAPGPCIDPATGAVIRRVRVGTRPPGRG